MEKEELQIEKIKAKSAHWNKMYLAQARAKRDFWSRVDFQAILKRVMRKKEKTGKYTG